MNRCTFDWFDLKDEKVKAVLKDERWNYVTIDSKVIIKFRFKFGSRVGCKFGKFRVTVWSEIPQYENGKWKGEGEHTVIFDYRSNDVIGVKPSIFEIDEDGNVNDVVLGINVKW